MRSWRDSVRLVTPYVPGEQPKESGIIKLNTNENPYPPSPAVARALRDLPAEELRRYPDPAAEELVGAIAEHCGVRPEQIFVGVGSDDVLAMAFLTFFQSSEPILFPDVTYSFYDVWADAFRIPYRAVPLDEELRIRPEDLCVPNGGVVFPNPNAPTGAALGAEAVEQIIRANPGSVVIVDEAYVDFGAGSVLPLIDRYDNLLVVQTFSKSRSLAGMRIGFAAGCEELIRYLLSFKYSFNSYTMSRAAIAAGTASVRDEAYFAETVSKIVRTRERVKEELRALGFTFPDSQANFIFASHPDIPARELYEELRAARIYVRYFDRPRTDNYLRITIGTDDEMDVLLDLLKKKINEKARG